MWFKQKDRKKDDNFSNDWTETGAWKGPRLNNGWAGGAAEIALEQTLEIAPNMHSRNPTSCFVRRTSKGTRVTFASNIHQIKEICSSLPLYDSGSTSAQSKEIQGSYNSNRTLQRNDAQIFKLIQDGSLEDLIKCFDEGANICCTDSKKRSPFVFISDLILQIRDELNRSNASPLPLMSPDERRSKNELLSIYEKKKVILKIYYMADKIINASRAMEELRSMDVLKLRIPYVSDLVIEKKAKCHHSVSMLFLTMSSDDGKMGNATPSVPFEYKLILA